MYLGGYLMKFEKLNDNKIKITLTIQDLTEKHIDFHSFMANTIESQDILLDMLEEAKRETGFDIEDANLKIEALALADTSFIFTITKMATEPNACVHVPRKKFTVKRKTLTSNSTQAVYLFYSFDDFCGFLHFIENSNLHTCILQIASQVLLYQYRDSYYLVLDDINLELIDKIKFYTAITEFSKYITNSKTFVSKLKESGNLVIKNNALKTGLAYFV